MHQFNIGDTVIGNEKAKYVYSVTTEGYVGIVKDISDSKICIDDYWVIPEYFDLVQPAADTNDWGSMFE